MMAQIYAAVVKIVVIDPQLRVINGSFLSDDQIFTHIFYSAWMTRSWTFQEAILARKWEVLFANSLYSVFGGRTRIFQSGLKTLKSRTLGDYTQYIPLLFPVRTFPPTNCRLLAEGELPEQFWMKLSMDENERNFLGSGNNFCYVVDKSTWKEPQTPMT